MSQYPKEQIWKIYEKLPDELKDAIFSHDTAENISNICEKNKITNSEKISQIARLTGDVLLGLLIPNELQESLEKELKLKKPIAKKIAFQIQRFVFYPVRKSLSALYQIEIAPAPATPVQERVKAEKPKAKKRIAKADTYREQIDQ